MSATFGSFQLRFTGNITALSAADHRALVERVVSSDGTIRGRAAGIIARVRAEGDAALRSMALEYDGATLDDLEVPRSEWEEALDALTPELRRAMERSAANIRSVHQAFLPVLHEVESEPGIVIGRRPDPLGRVGIYAPGGRAAYPSSVLMGAVPARVAGVGEIIVCSPPVRGSRGPSAVVLAAAALAGADRLFSIGGAGAVAALAYGTESVPRVDRIIGPGNAYVAEAKIQVASVVAIDSPAGPSELLVIADPSADPSVVAREMLAQAEHDPLAAVVTVTTSVAHADAILQMLAALLPFQARSGIIRESLATQSGVLVADSLSSAIEFANTYAAEHLLILASDQEEVLSRVRNAGTVFVGPYASVSYGDYMTGANHVLPTGGLARSYSGLSTADFVRWTTYQRVSRDAAARMADDVGVFADAEGLDGHAYAARAWR